MRTKLLGLFLLLLLTVVGAAQEDDDGQATLDLLEERQVAVRPLTEVTESAEQILDITSDSARLNFIGTIPLACTVVFGTDTDFGRASIDLDMNGGAIIEHNPLMLDLEPDTEYFYRVQGSAEDGTLYVGEIGSFRTAPQSDEVTDNLLSPERGATILGVSSVFGSNESTWGLENALDGNLNTAWSSDGDGSDAWFEIELAQPAQINTLELRTRAMSDGTSRIFEFTVTTDTGETYGPFTVPDAESIHTYEVNFTAQTLRFDVTDSSGGNTGAVEVAAYGAFIADE